MVRNSIHVMNAPRVLEACRGPPLTDVPSHCPSSWPTSHALMQRSEDACIGMLWINATKDASFCRLLWLHGAWNFCLFCSLFLFFLCQTLEAGRAQKDRLPTGPAFLLTPAPFLQPLQSLLLPDPRLLLLLVLPALVEVLHHHAHKHVEHEEADDQQKGDEVQQHPGIVVPNWLERGVGEVGPGPERRQRDVRRVQVCPERR